MIVDDHALEELIDNDGRDHDPSPEPKRRDRPIAYALVRGRPGDAESLSGLLDGERCWTGRYANVSGGGVAGDRRQV